MAAFDLICNGPITKQDLEEILQKCFKTQTRLTKADGVIISGGLGFTSDVMRIHLEWDVKDGLPVKVIAKAPKIENVGRLKEIYAADPGQDVNDMGAHIISLIHQAECNAYEIFHVQQPIPIPKIYGYWYIGKEHPGLIVMEDLGDKAMVVDNISTGLNLRRWQSIVEHIADLHAWSLTTDIPWRDKVADINLMAESFKGLNKTASTSIKTVKDKYPEFFGHVDEEKVLKQVDFNVIMKTHLLHQKFMPDVFQHGDIWINNIMFEKNPDGTLSDKVAAFLDWQFSIRGSCINDFARLLGCCINHEMRRANDLKMLRIYYDRFKSKAGEKLTATFEQMEYIYRETVSFNLLMTTILADFILRDIVKIDEDETGWRKTEMLNRLKAGYDDAAKYYGWTVTEKQT